MSAFGGTTRLGKALRTCAVSVALTGSFAIAGVRAGESPVIAPSSSVAADAGTPAPEEAGRPVCARVGTRSEGWAWPSGRFIHWAKCKGMVPKCHAAKDGKDGRDVEGWYANGALIAPARCSESGKKQR